MQQYVGELRSGQRGAGLLELYFTCMLYSVQVCVWVAGDAQPLLVTRSEQPGPLAYNIVLANGAHDFRSVEKLRRRGGAGGISFGSFQTRIYQLGAGERRGTEPVRDHKRARLGA